MSENSTGARALLTHPLLYETFSALVGGKRARETFIGEQCPGGASQDPGPGLRPRGA